LSGAVYEQVCALQADGLYLAAHDMARAALDDGADDVRLRHRALDTLTRAGATSVALDLFNRWQLADSADDEIAGLYARLLKDFALERHDPEAADAAREAYTALWLRTGKVWLAANAAAMALLAGRAGHAREAAAAIGALADKGDYWSAATAAELALLRGDPDTAARWLEIAETRGNGDLDRRVKIRRQMRWEATLLGIDAGLVEALRIPDVLHYCGQPPTGKADETAFAARIADMVDNVGSGYGSLSAGGDIIVAEALLRRGARLHVLLPFPPDAFEALAVRPAGDAWVERFRACLAGARVQVVEPAPHDDWSYTFAARRAMGLARLRARQMDANVRQLAIWDGTPARAARGTSVDVAAWQAAGLETDIVPGPWPRAKPGRMAPRPAREPRAVLFGDLPSFGALDEAGLATFYGEPMRAIAAALEGERPEYRNSWGDAVQCVFAHPNAAARAALAVQAALSPEAFAATGLPASLTPRLALDHGALLPVYDPVQAAHKFAGTVMTRAARIEPVTPPGRIYATETFACEMALEPFPAVTCDYAGLTRTAKDYGILPLYLVRASGRGRNDRLPGVPAAMLAGTLTGAMADRPRGDAVIAGVG
jgi:adenylate cyclase